MSTRILHDHDADRACLYDSVTDTAFGPVFNGGEPFDDAADEAEKFIAWLDKHPAESRRFSANFRSDPRAYGESELLDRYSEFRRKTEAGEAT